MTNDQCQDTKINDAGYFVPNNATCWGHTIEVRPSKRMSDHDFCRYEIGMNSVNPKHKLFGK